MKIIVTYDVSTTDSNGRRRLNKVAKTCCNYGLRVQNSVFECQIQWDKFVELQAALLQIIDKEKDSLRIYNLGNRWVEKVFHYGVRSIPDLDNDMLLL